MVIKKTYTPRPSRLTPPPSPSPVVANVEAAEAVRNVVPPARDARLPKESANLQDGVIPSPLGRSSNGDDAARLGHSEVPVQEVTPDTNQSPAKKRKKKSKRAKKERKAKNQNLESSSTLGRSSDGDDAARLGHSEMSEDPVQELAPVKEQNSPVQHHENLTQPESLNKSSTGQKTPEKDRKRHKIFKKIKKRLKRFGKKISKKFEKKIINSLTGVALSVIIAMITGTTISNNPMEQQGQTQVINNIYCPASESASPVAITPKQPDLRADSSSTQIYCVCCIVQQ